MKKFLTFVLVLAMVLSVSSVALATGKAAKIGTTEYDTLEEAVAAAANGDTITLLKSSNGNGIVINKSLTIDLGGFTYTIDGYTVGSRHTETLGIQILNSAANVVIKNGKIVGSSDADTPACKDGSSCPKASDAAHLSNPRVNHGVLMLINNYTNLSLIGVELIGNKEAEYVLSNNSGTVVIENTTITAADGNVAFDVYASSSYSSKPEVTVTGNSVINGDIEVAGASGQSGQTLTIEGGVFNGSITNDNTGNVSITGGDFSEKPDANFIDSAAEVIGNAEDGFVVVVPELPGSPKPEFIVIPGAFDFGPVAKGGSFTAKSFTVYNSGNSELVVQLPVMADCIVKWADDTIGNKTLGLMSGEAYSAVFTVQPNANLAVAEYDRTGLVEAYRKDNENITCDAQIAVKFEITAPATTPSSGGPSVPDVEHIGGNTFSVATNQAPISVEIDGAIVPFTMNGNKITVGCIQPGSRWITVNWGNVSNTVSFTPDVQSYCADVSIPKTGGMSIWAAIAEFLGF